jgi:hypothetical protein
LGILGLGLVECGELVGVEDLLGVDKEGGTLERDVGGLGLKEYLIMSLLDLVYVELFFFLFN